jgi:hypothetical protein
MKKMRRSSTCRAKERDVDNRKDKRISEQNDVWIKDGGVGWKPGAPPKINASTHDLSISGARISCKAGFPVGHLLHIVVYFKRSGQMLCVDGEVKWSAKGKGRRYEVGVEFLHALPDTVVALIGHIYGKETGVPLSVS